MNRPSLTRRRFALATAAALPAIGRPDTTASITAREVVARIQKNLGVEWRTNTVDTFKAGNPDTPVKGIATTFIATMPVLERAVRGGRNFVITHEPTFYNHTDQTSHLAEDPVYRGKREFIDRNGLVVWRFHDHWHMRKPDPVLTGLVQALGWEKRQSATDPHLCTLDPLPFERLVQNVARTMKASALRAAGNPKLQVKTVAIYPGFAAPLMATKFQPQADVCLLGETNEWEGGLYAQDAAALGKGLIVLGHQPSEEPGMKLCASWLKELIPEIPVEWLPAGELLWRPSSV